jgi:hypothetical protein
MALLVLLVLGACSATDAGERGEADSGPTDSGGTSAGQAGSPAASGGSSSNQNPTTGGTTGAGGASGTGGSGETGGAGTPGSGGADGVEWRPANLTWYTSWPACCPESDNYDPSADTTECEVYNGCTWAGYFAGVDGRQSASWVEANNIAAVHSDDFDTYRGKTLRLRQGDRQIDVTVYDMCSDNDCDGCCTQNASRVSPPFLIDLESYTKERFGSGSGTVEWYCVNC